MSGRLRWKLGYKPTGLSVIGSGPRSSILWDGETKYAHVNPIGGGSHGPVTGWYWVCSSDAPGGYVNTCNDPRTTEAEAKADAMAWIKSKLPKS